MKNNSLRAIWIIPNILFYLLSLTLLGFIMANAQDLREIHRLEIWILALLILLLVSFFGTFQIMGWIKKGKM
ncbi:hypothetical protein QMA09_09200 [Planococcus sp. APC 3906]|uniref:hypothetical protein n=1 Tax=Planococcus sp. APC 3906 TaxID=3035194 RepID=UPI0025B3763F|nr:hypothetical protein [Planococcus sp. APC 3906]MDN3450367.1 hypothetical protein [Planococcus sp. APC 3906]